jgi:hypothetical protein
MHVIHVEVHHVEGLSALHDALEHQHVMGKLIDAVLV